MQKRKRWQFYLIVAVTVLTIYNILPTIFYYAKPLKDPIGMERAEKVEKSISHRVNSLEKQSVEWVQSYCKLLKIKPKEILFDKENPKQIEITFQRLRTQSFLKDSFQEQVL